MARRARNTITGDGNHTLLWRYTESGGSSSYAYVDYVQWTGAGPIEEEEEEPEWQTVSYTYDPAGRRIEKKVDGTTQVKYVYDGDHILAEYNNAGTLLRKYVHGPCVDEPICMIEASGTYAGTHYYHYDALGSVVAMTNSSGNVVELYEYSVYGQVAASDASHPNRFMFTGREFDKDTGLYYYRARYYNPEIGRFLQTDPIGYADGMNLHRYCGNNAINAIDPSGMIGRFLNSSGHMLRYQLEDGGGIVQFKDLSTWMEWMAEEAERNATDLTTMAGYKLAGGAKGDFDEDLFWNIQAMIALGYQEYKIDKLDEEGVTIAVSDAREFLYSDKVIRWDPRGDIWTEGDQSKYGNEPDWLSFPALALLAHECEHGYQDVTWAGGLAGNDHGTELRKRSEEGAMIAENAIAYAFYKKVPGYGKGGEYEIAGPRTYFYVGQTSKMYPYSRYAILSMTWEEWAKKRFVPAY
jgi:RHS repeat-associated protein